MPRRRRSFTSENSLGRHIADCLRGTVLWRFLQAKSPMSRVQACLQEVTITRGVTEQLNKYCSRTHMKKNNTQSNKRRADGNLIFSGPRPESALSIYGEALRLAEPGSNEETLAYSNRSAVFYHLKQFHDCLSDIKMALPNSDNKLKLKLLLRKAKALYQLGLETEKTVKEVNECIETSDWGNTKDAVDQQVADLKTFLETPVDPAPEMEKEPDPLPEPLGGFNPTFPSASKFVELRSSQAKGKFVVATRDFNVGDILFVEKPALQVVCASAWTEFCQYCMKQISCYIPCKTCNMAVFCGEECRVKAWDEFHHFECPQGIELFQELDASYLAFRMVMQNIEFPNSLQLQGHLNKRSINEQIQLTMTAVLLQLYVQKCFPSLVTDNLGGRFLVALDRVYSNYQSINHVEFRQKIRQPLSPDSTPDLKCIELLPHHDTIGMGVYPSLKKMNHSCIRKVIKIHHGAYLIVKVVAPIKAGEEVCDSYDIDSTSLLSESRQDLLRQRFFFKCKCPACTADRDPSVALSSLKCLRCSGMFHEDSCLDCGFKDIDTVLVGNVFLSSIIDFDEVTKSNAQELLNKVENQLLVARKLLYRDNLGFITILACLAKCYNYLGFYIEEFSALYEQFIRNKSCYGEHSADIVDDMVSILNCNLHLLQSDSLKTKPEALKIFRKSQDLLANAPFLFELILGTWSENYAMVMEKIDIFKHCVKDLNLPKNLPSGNNALPDDP